ncbi:MAG TPA: TlpA disulfide reductase family protein [Polyangiaceae bacterium]|nr:TlpA disulfide reductase family protein [Polyangiaceae bacterium]
MRTSPLAVACVAFAASVASVASVSCGSAGGQPPASAPSPLLSRALPDFRRPAVGGGEEVETARLRGRVVLVDFFAENCIPCARSLPAVEALHRAMPELSVVGVSEDEDAAGARRMVERFGLTFPVVHDAQHVLAGRYRVVAMPATFVADASGVVRWRGDQAHDEGELRAVIEGARLLGHAPDRRARRADAVDPARVEGEGQIEV